MGAQAGTKISFFRRYKFPVLWAAFIAVLCGIPGKDIPSISFLELLEFDKFVHASVFFILVYLLVKSFKKSEAAGITQHYPFFIASSLAIGYGALLEILQGLVFIDRSADVLDFIANSFGALLALVWLKGNSKKSKSS